MINTVIKQIEEQQVGKENTAPYYVGEQLKDIIRNNPQAAEIVGQDLKVKEMSIVECEKKIKAYADKHKKNNFNYFYLHIPLYHIFFRQCNIYKKECNANKNSCYKKQNTGIIHSLLSIK